MEHPILPKGMTLKTLYDDDLFNKWFIQCFRPQPQSYERLVQKQIQKNLKNLRRKRARQEQQKGSSDESQGFSSDQEEEEEKSDPSETRHTLGEKSLAQEFEEQLR